MAFISSSRSIQRLYGREPLDDGVAAPHPLDAQGQGQGDCRQQPFRAKCHQDANAEKEAVFGGKVPGKVPRQEEDEPRGDSYGGDDAGRDG